jgi:hypothetical protein
MERIIFTPRFLRVAALIFAFFIVIYAMVYIDLVLRARSAYFEGEKYLAWNAHPELKKAYYDNRLAKKEGKIDQEFRAGRLTVSERQEKLTLARFREHERLSESSLKYAYVWFQTAVELFSPPESHWVKISRPKMKETRALWRKELDSQR